MSVILWSVIAVGVAFGVLVAAVRRAQRRLPPIALAPGETMPATPLQRAARTTFALTSLLTLSAAALVVARGVDVTWNNDAVRLTATGLLVAGLAVLLYLIFWSLLMMRILGLLAGVLLGYRRA